MPSDHVHRVLQEVYHPFERPVDVARCFAEVAVRVTGARWARVALEGNGAEGALVVWVRGGARSRGVLPGSGEPGEAHHAVRYQGRELGHLSLPGPHPSPVAADLARAVAHHLIRLRVVRLAREEHGRDVALVGASRALAEVDRFLEGASRSSLPVLLVGAAGSEVERVGLVLHLLGADARRPFLQVHCGTLNGRNGERRWAELFRRAAGGTLLLAHLETLDARAQKGLLQVLETGVAVRPWSHRQPPASARVLASIRDDVGRQVESGTLDERLLAALDVLRIDLPPLRQRREDIRPLVEHFLRTNSGLGGTVEMTEEAMAACVAHDWPGDRMELARDVARLVVLAGPSGRVELRHVREMVRGAGDDLPAGPPPEGGGDDGIREDAAERLLAYSRDLHPSLRRAVELIVRHEGGALTLSDVAAAAHVSESHLAHLFRREMGTTFTRLLSSLRVERTKQLLRQDPWAPISTVATKAGFTHVRQLERTFKKLVGCTPSGYRQRVRRSSELRGTWRDRHDL